MNYDKQRTLDHGYVQRAGVLGDDLEPVRSARMSTDTPTGVDVIKDNRLNERLWRERHTSPFESNILVVELQLPLFVLQQIDRHRTVSICNSETYVERVAIEDYDSFRTFHSENEFSARYSTMPDLSYSPLPSRIGKKGIANKQGTEGGFSDQDVESALEALRVATSVARGEYDRMIAMGVSSELARFALTYTQYTKVRIQANLLNWLKFLDLRLRPDVQLETRIYARQIARIIRELWPACWRHFEEHTLYAITFSAHELAVIRSCWGQPGDRREVLHQAAVASAAFTDADARRLVDRAFPTTQSLDLVDCALQIPESW